MDNRVMMITTTQRQIEREAEKDLDAALAVMDAAEVEVEMAQRDEGLGSPRYADSLDAWRRSIFTSNAAINNLEKTCLEEEN